MPKQYNKVCKVELVWKDGEIIDETFYFEDDPEEPHSLGSFGWGTKTRAYLESILDAIANTPVMTKKGKTKWKAPK